MRLLVVHPHLNVVGGSEILTRILVYELSNLGVEVVVATRERRQELFPETKHVKFEAIRDLPEYCTKARGELQCKLVSLFHSLDAIVSKHEPDAALVMLQEPAYTVLLKLAKPGLGVALYIHYPVEEEATPQNMAKFIAMYRFPNMYNSLYRVADLYMVNSNYTAKALYEMYGIEANVVYPAIHWDYFHDEVDVHERRDNIIVTVGRFVPQKRHDLLIEVFRREVKPQVKDARLVIVGVRDERYKDYYMKIRELAESAGDVELIDRVLTPKDMALIYRRAKVYVHLRIGEHFGMAPVEAMSQATVPILPEASGLAEFISHGRSGFLFKTVEEAGKLLTRTLKMSVEELAKVRRNCVRTAWYFNPDRFARDVLGYMKLLVRG